MFQNGKERKFAHEENICVSCTKDVDCKFKPTNYGWRVVLTYCKEYETQAKGS